MPNTEVQRIQLTFLKSHQEAELNPPRMAPDLLARPLLSGAHWLYLPYDITVKSEKDQWIPPSRCLFLHVYVDMPY